MSSGADSKAARPTLTAGVIEIAAVTTLIGSSTAESLILGSRGASGVLWASMSVFGIFSVIRGAITAATPNWLRETLGVRNAAIEQIIGSEFDLSWRNTYQNLYSAPAIGIQSVMQKDGTGTSAEEFVTQSQSSVFAFNHLTSRCIHSVRTGVKGIGDIHIYQTDPYRQRWMKSAMWTDIYGVLLSALKLLEIFAFYALRAQWLAWLATGPWIVSLLSASCLIFLGVSQEDDLRGPQTDLLIGELPSPTTVGGERAIILGIPAYTRHSVAWTLIWAVCAITNLASLLLHYIVLGQLEPMVFYAWAGFQLTWLAGRMAFFHYAGTHYNLKFTLSQTDWKELSLSNRNRVRSLAYGMAKHLINVHPRRPYSYEGDATAMPEFGIIAEHYPCAGDETVEEVAVHVLSVVGDTMLASVCWVAGAVGHLKGAALYDSCIVQFVNGEKLFSVPAARVLSGPRPSNPLDDEEGGLKASFPSKGGENTGPDDVFWVYWIPYKPQVWLQMRSKDRKIVGQQMATVVSDEQITSSLQGDDLFVSLRGVDEVKETVNVSRAACQAVTLFML